MRNFTKPLKNTKLEADAQKYAASYNCSIEVARRDVMDESIEPLTDMDAFHERMEIHS